MDRRHNCRDESATDLPRSPAVRVPAQSIGHGHPVLKTEDAPETRPGGRGRRSTRETGRHAIVAGLLRNRRDNFGGDPLTTGAKRPPRSRDGARCDATFQKETAGRWSPFAFLTQLVERELNSGGI